MLAVEVLKNKGKLRLRSVFDPVFEFRPFVTKAGTMELNAFSKQLNLSSIMLT